MRTGPTTFLGRKAADLLAELDSNRESALMAQLEGIARGEQAAEDGRMLAQHEAMQHMARWLS
ncbi:hypothetical protein AB4Z01_23270 [Inquilinus sp. YAF38]|uniref:hypothetical protein n=1 Tax=Inquilinus sp. YAF38 TaxID=3233084 RepID=UPI003F926BE0